MNPPSCISTIRCLSPRWWNHPVHWRHPVFLSATWWHCCGNCRASRRNLSRHCLHQFFVVPHRHYAMSLGLPIRSHISSRRHSPISPISRNLSRCWDRRSSFPRCIDSLHRRRTGHVQSRNCEVWEARCVKNSHARIWHWKGTGLYSNKTLHSLGISWQTPFLVFPWKNALCKHCPPLRHLFVCIHILVLDEWAVRPS